MEQQSAASKPMSRMAMRRAAKALAKPGLDQDLLHHSMALAGRRSSSTQGLQETQIVEAEVSSVELSTPGTEPVQPPCDTVAADG